MTALCHLVPTMRAFACHAGGVTVFIRPTVSAGHLTLRVLGVTA